MSTPTVTELRPRTEAVGHDTFVDDLSAQRSDSHDCQEALRQRSLTHLTAAR
jgi:hypothetical protein